MLEILYVSHRAKLCADRTAFPSRGSMGESAFMIIQILCGSLYN